MNKSGNIYNENEFVKCPASAGGRMVHVSKISDCEPKILCRVVDEECVKQKGRFGFRFRAPGFGGPGLDG